MIPSFGSLPLSSSVLSNAVIGLWAMELDEGAKPRLYGDEALRSLAELREAVSPEELYSSWLESIMPYCRRAVHSALKQMTDGNCAEVQYTCANRVFRLSGIRNAAYSRGTRLEGTLQDITALCPLPESQHDQNDFSLFLLSNLSDSYATLYCVSVDTGEYRFITRDSFFRDQVDSRLSHRGNFFLDSRISIDTLVCEEDRSRMEFLTDARKMEKFIGKSGFATTDYRLKINNALIWYRVKAVKITDTDGEPCFVLGVMNIEQQRSQQEMLEESQIFSSYFLAPYESAYYVNLKDFSWRALKRAKNIEDNYPIAKDYTDSLRSYILKEVHPFDRENAALLLSSELIRERLSDAQSFSLMFRVISEPEERIIRSEIIRGVDEDHVAFGFKDVTTELLEQRRYLLGALPLSADILNKSSIGLWSCELDTGKPPRLYADKAMLSLTGLSTQLSPESTYRFWYDRVDEQSRELVSEAIEKMGSGEHAEVQFPWQRSDGRTAIVRLGGIHNPAYTQGIRIEGTYQDVTETVRFDEEKLKLAKERAKELTKSTLRADALKFISDHKSDLDSFLDFFGKRILDLFGCEQVVYRGIDGRQIVSNAPGIEIIPHGFCDDCPLASFVHNHYDETGSLIIDDCSNDPLAARTPPTCPVKSFMTQQIYSGDVLVGLLTVQYLREPHSFTEYDMEIMSTVSAYLGILVGQIEAEKTELAKLKAESSNKAKTEFLFNMSHDIRTPMNALLGYTDIALRHENDPARVHDSLEKIRFSGQHLLNLINDILEMSRIEAGRLELVEAPLNLFEVVEGVTQMSQALALAKGVNFSSVFGEITHPYIYADELHINEVLINLISNAIKYTPAGGHVEYSVEQYTEPRNGIARYRLTVKDDGIGMSEEFQTHLFETFSRENSSTISRQEGTGLGLAIAKRITELAGGSISVQSQQGVGSSFVVELPFRILNEEEIRTYCSERMKFPGTEDESLLSGKRILLVEDNEINREIALELLHDALCEADYAEDGSIALRKISEKGIRYYDCILMDIQMPVMDGFEATAAIRSLPGGDGVPIIALSANAFKEDADRSLSAGMNAHMAKPFDLWELISVIRSLTP